MKKIVSIIIIGLFLMGSVNVEAQSRKRKKAKKVRVHKKVHKHNKRNYKTVRYQRKNVVIVKPRKVTRVKVLPVGHNVVVFKKRNYHYHGGRYYQYKNGVYATTYAPRGLRIKVLPIGYRTIVFSGHTRYYYRGVYYNKVNNEYEVVEPLVGAVVPELPEDNVDEVSIDGVQYYEYDGVLYKPKVTTDGVQYEVMGEVGE